MKKWFIDDVFVRDGKVYDRGYYIREDGIVEWTEPVPNGRTFEFPVSECFHPAGALSIEPGDPISIEDGELLGDYMEAVIDGIKIRDSGNVVTVYGNWLEYYDEETEVLLDTSPVEVVNGLLVDINKEFVIFEKEDDFELRILDGLGNVIEALRG